MRTTGIFTVHHYEIPFKRYGEPIYLIPFGDVHRSAPLCDDKKWIEFLHWAKRKERCYFLGMGDYDDLASTSERRILTNDDVHDSTRETLEEVYTKNTERLTKEIAFMRGRLIGLVEGNHYAQFQNGSTTTQLMAQLLGCKYLGVTSFIILSLRYDKKHAHRVVIWAHHGRGAGRTTGSSVNAVEQMEKIAEADIYLMGHDHKKSVAHLNKFHVSSHANNFPKVRIKKILLARTGAFLRGYVNGKASYVADACLPPTDLGVVKIELTPKREKVNGEEERYVDIHASI